MNSQTRMREQSGTSVFVYALAFIYLLFILAAEFALVIYEPVWGLLLYSLILVSLLVFSIYSDSRLFMVGLSSVPIMRLVNYGTPFVELTPPQQRIAVSLILAVYILFSLRSKTLKPLNVLALPANYPTQFGIAMMGIVIGAAQFVVQPVAASAFSAPFDVLILVTAILLVAFVEETILRGILLQSVMHDLGPTVGITYSAVVYASLFSAYNSSALVILAFIVALYYGTVIYRWNGYYGVLAAHIVGSLVYHMVMPALFPR